MRKEVTVFAICLLALFADIICIRQTIIIKQNGVQSFDDLSLVGTIAIQIISALFLIWLKIVLFKRIYRKGFFINGKNLFN